MSNKYEHLAKQARHERHRWRSCERKRRYATRAEASADKGQSVYECQYCDGWHRSGAVLRLAKRKRRP